MKLPWSKPSQQPSLNLPIFCVRETLGKIRKLLDDAVDKTERKDILDRIYGKDGILHADDTICFEEKCNELEEHSNQISNKFQKYFTGRLKTLLKQKVNEPVRHKKVPENWTNNNCESLNHVLKQAIDWRSKPLTELVDILQDLATGQFKDLRSAMLGTGEYRLAESHSQFRMDQQNRCSEKHMHFSAYSSIYLNF